MYLDSSLQIALEVHFLINDNLKLFKLNNSSCTLLECIDSAKLSHFFKETSFIGVDSFMELLDDSTKVIIVLIAELTLPKINHEGIVSTLLHCASDLAAEFFV